jgi:hypothetical protein
VSVRSFIIPKLEKSKGFNQEIDGAYHVIDVNLWFKSNNLTPSCMNEVRQYIFEEWLHKKISGSKSKISLGSNLVIVYENPTDLFIKLLKQKISEVLEYDFCDIVLLH